MRRFIPILFLWLLASPAVSADEYKWLGNSDGEGAGVLYGITESDGFKIGFYCARKSRIVSVSFEYEPPGAQNKMRAAIRLAVPGRDANVTMPATGERFELDDKFVFQGETLISGQLRRIFSGDGTLQVRVGEYVETIPLQGAQEAAKDFLAACPARMN